MKTAEENIRKWEETGQTKIVLKITSKEGLKEVHEKAKEKGLPTQIIQDAGRTQIEPGSYTVCAIGPGPSSAIDEITRHLKLM